MKTSQKIILIMLASTIRISHGAIVTPGKNHHRTLFGQLLRQGFFRRTGHQTTIPSSLRAASSSLSYDHDGDTAAGRSTDSSRRRASFTIYYNDVYEVQLPPKHRFPMSKYRKVRELVQKWIDASPIHKDQTSGLECEFRVSPLATVPELETTHCPSYIHRYLVGNMTKDEQRNVGFPWSKQSVKRCLSSVGGTLAAACTVLDRTIADESKKTNNNIHWGAHVAAGTHHAFYDRGEGFSVFSDMAVAANSVLEKYPGHVKRILLVDLDVHQGNGNAVLFQNNPNVKTFSIHCKANYFSQKQESDLDIELPAGCDDKTYLITLQHWLNRLLRGEGGKFDLIFYQAGVDVLDVDRLGRMSLTSSGVERRNEMVYRFAEDLKVPLVICMGGGYPRGDNWSPIIEAHANVYYQAYQHLKNMVAKPAIAKVQ